MSLVVVLPTDPVTAIILGLFFLINIEASSMSNPIIGFLGRIVKIKDVKTFIKSANYVLQKYPNAKFLIAGPTQEDEEYYKICEKLIFSLKLENNINFLDSFVMFLSHPSSF